MLTTVAAISLLIWLYLYFAHHGFWHADQRLPHDIRPMTAWPSVVAIVPARNESATIARCVEALAAQDYAGSLRILVVDDGSTDDTAAAARAADATGRVTVISAPPLEAGWTGKLWALNAGLQHARENGLTPVYVWFTDADIVHPPETLSYLVARAVHKYRDLVSLMVRLHCRSSWERLLIPAFVYFFQMLYPFRAANDDHSKVAAAAGGCILIRREALMAAGGLHAIRGALIDDCALARLIKNAGGRLWVGLSDGSASLRAAYQLAPLWTMVSRTAFTQLKHSNTLLFFTIIGMTLIFLVPPLAVLLWPWHGVSLAALMSLLAWILMAGTYVPTLKDYGQQRWAAPLLPVAAALYTAMTFASALAHWRQRGGAWKGRTYPPAPPPDSPA